MTDAKLSVPPPNQYIPTIFIPVTIYFKPQGKLHHSSITLLNQSHKIPAMSIGSIFLSQNPHYQLNLPKILFSYNIHP